MQVAEEAAAAGEDATAGGAHAALKPQTQAVSASGEPISGEAAEAGGGRESLGGSGGEPPSGGGGEPPGDGDPPSSGGGGGEEPSGEEQPDPQNPGAEDAPEDDEVGGTEQITDLDKEQLDKLLKDMGVEDREIRREIGKRLAQDHRQGIIPHEHFEDAERLRPYVDEIRETENIGVRPRRGGGRQPPTDLTDPWEDEALDTAGTDTDKE
jgi:hypothetical protein